MLPLRHVVGWRIASALLLLLVFASMVVPAWLLTTQMQRSVVAFDKWLHGFTFFVLALWFSGQYARRAYWQIAIGLVLFGGATELVQRTLIYRNADPADMLANLAGVAAGLMVALSGVGGWSLRVEAWLNARRAGS